MNRAWAGNSRHIPITVSLRTSTNARNITRFVSGVRYRHVIPGGFADCTVDLNKPIREFLPEVVQYATLRLTDSTSGAVLWEGRLEDPGKTVSSSGQGWQLTALGGMAHAQDITAPYIAIDGDLSRWRRGYGTQTYVSDSQEDDSDPAPAGGRMGPTIKFSAPSGTVIGGTSILARYYYPCFVDSGQIVASMYAAARTGPQTGVHASFFVAQFLLFNDTELTGSADVPLSGPSLNSPSTFQARLIPTTGVAIGWTDRTRTVPVIGWRYEDDVSTTAGAATWAGFGGGLTVRPIMHFKNGAEVSTLSGFDFDVLRASASQIVEDLLGGGRLPKFDGANAAIVPSDDKYIYQFAYPDPVSTDQLLTDLMTLDPGRYWAAWEMNALGKARFEWALWPSTVRYVIGMQDGIDITASTEEMYNAVSVRWVDALGRIRRTRRTSNVPALTAAGLVREAAIDLGDNASSLISAEIAGDGFLADHAYPRATGTLTVARPVMDRYTGRMVPARELRPGCLVQVAGLNPSAYSQGATARNGVNVFRVIGVEFDSNSGTASLELDSTPASMSTQVADANRAVEERRRR